MIKPAGHRILVRPDSLEEVDDSVRRARAMNLELPPMTKRQEQTAVDRGTVVSVGHSAFKDFGDLQWCKEGDLVAYAKYGGKFVKDPETDEDLLIINDEDIIAVLTK